MGYYVANTLNGWKRFIQLRDAKKAVLESSRKCKDTRYYVCDGSRIGPVVCYALGGELYKADGYLYERSDSDDTIRFERRD